MEKWIPIVTKNVAVPEFRISKYSCLWLKSLIIQRMIGCFETIQHHSITLLYLWFEKRLRIYNYDFVCFSSVKREEIYLINRIGTDNANVKTSLDNIFEYCYHFCNSRFSCHLCMLLISTFENISVLFPKGTGGLRYTYLG